MFPAFKTVAIHQVQKAVGSELMPDVEHLENYPWKIITEMLSFSKAQKRCSDRYSVQRQRGVWSEVSSSPCVEQDRQM